ncbi:MAG: hypothetical protein ACM3SY_06485 [Candidatus Omnitrophota bacterium]
MDVNLNIEEKELDYIKDELKGKVNPVDLHEIANRVALFKTRDNRSHRVKIYNPNCEFKVGDLLYKEYPGKIPVGSKKFIEITEGVVLKVIGVRSRYGINEIQLSYEGTSEFKKYISYLERQKIELLLPHKQSRPGEKPEYLPEDIDPRRQLDPLEKRDFSALVRKLAGVLNKDPQIALISNKILLKENLKPILPEVFDRIKEFLKENKKSETTEFLVENFVKIRPEDETFDAYCFALNYRMQIDYKIDFQQTQNIGWGKWNLISVIYYLKKNSPISDTNPLTDRANIANKKNLVYRRKKFEESLFPEGNASARYYLAQREITAGAIRLKPGFFDLGDSIEVELTDTKQKKTYLVYYYKDDHLMLGFKEIFERNKVLQGSILTFEMINDDGQPTTTGGKLHFNIRMTKKGTIADRIDYIPEKKAFIATAEKVSSTAFVNKSMFLEAAVFKTLDEKLDEFRKMDTFNKLVHKVFLEFGIKERNYEIHILRLYHILDLIYPTDMKLLEEVILGNDEFIPDEKMPGVFYLDSDAVIEIEEEESKRKEIQIDENKKKREELKKKKLEQERLIKDDIRRKREERRKKREQEMWEKERLRRELEEKKVQEQRKKKEKEIPKEAPRKTSPTPPAPAPTPAPTAAAPAPAPTPIVKAPDQPVIESSPQPAESPASVPAPPQKEINKKEFKKEFVQKEVPQKEVPFKPKPRPEAPRTQTEPPLSEEAARKKDIALKWEKKKLADEKEKSVAKPFKKAERKPQDEELTEEEIKREIELERLKENMRERKEAKKQTDDSKKKVAYKDDGGFGGILASKLDKIVKQDSDKNETEKK